MGIKRGSYKQNSHGACLDTGRKNIDRLHISKTATSFLPRRLLGRGPKSSLAALGFPGVDLGPPGLVLLIELLLLGLIAATGSVSAPLSLPFLVHTCFRAASASRFSRISFSLARSALASSVLPASCSLRYRSLAAAASIASRSRRLGATLSFSTPAAASSTDAGALVCCRALREWFGLAGIAAAVSSSSDSESLGGMSPTSTGFLERAMAASLRAFFSFLRSSRLSSAAEAVLVEGPASDSEPDSSSEEDSSSLSASEGPLRPISLPSSSSGRRSREKCLPPVGGEGGG